MTILYEKIGRRYVPVRTDDWRIYDMAKEGHILISVDKNMRSFMYGVDPARAPVLAAMHEVREAMRNAMYDASEFKPKVTKLTTRHLNAWKRYQAAIPKSERNGLWAGSIGDGIDAAIKVLSDKLSNDMR